MKNAVIYARYSSDRQREESIEGQIRVCQDYARRNGFNIINIYTDRALTGRSDKRPGFQMMIRDAATHTFQYVIVYKLNRFSRDRYDSANYKHKLKKQGVKLLSAMENISDDPAGILLESVIEGISEYYSAELSENVIRGMTQSALEGKWPGGNIPLGYKLDKENRLIIDEGKAPIVRAVFQMFLDGMSVPRIVQELNNKKYTTNAGKEFSRSRVYYILHNERYIGVFMWKDIRKDDLIPPIVSKDTFYLAQSKVKKMKKHPYRTNGKYLLSGKIFCAACGSKVAGTSGKSCMGAKYYYYACSHHHKSSRYPYCETKNIRADVLEDLIYSKTNEIISNKAAVQAIARQAVKLQGNTSASLEVQALENRISDVSKKVQNCVRAIESGIISDAVSVSLSENERILAALKDELAKAKLLQESGSLTEEKICYFFEKIGQKAKETEKYKNILLTSLVRAVFICNDYIEIQYNYAEQLPILTNPVRIENSSCESTNGGHNLRTHELNRLIFYKRYFCIRIAV